MAMSRLALVGRARAALVGRARAAARPRAVPRRLLSSPQAQPLPDAAFGPAWSVRAGAAATAGDPEAVSPEKLARIARLSGLAVDGDGLGRVHAAVTSVIRWAGQIRHVPTDDVEPMLSPVEDEPMLMREGGEVENAPVADVLANAARTDRGFFVAPKVVDLEDE